MRLDWLHRLTAHPGPFATVCTDVLARSGAGPAHAHRWAAHEVRLAELGAPPDLVRTVSGALGSVTRRGGRVVRVVVAAADGVLLDQVLPPRSGSVVGAPEHATWGPVPDLVAVARALSRSTSCLLVEVGASRTRVSAVSSRGDELEAATVVGDHDVLPPVPGGGWEHSRRLLGGADPGRCGARAVAATVDAEIRRHRPDLVLVRGADEPVAALLERCSTVGARVVRVGLPRPGGGAPALLDEVTTALDEGARRRTEEVVARFALALHGARDAVTGLPEVVAALRRAQVDELLLADGAPADALWVTGRPHQVATSRDGLTGIAGEPVSVPAEVALVWAAVGTGAGVTSVPAQLAGWLDDGVGALLRRPAATGASTAARSRVAAPGNGTYT